MTFRPSFFLFLFDFVEGFDDFADKGMADNVFVGEEDCRDAFDILEHRDALEKAGVLFVRKVNLGCVASDYEFGIGSHTSQEHFELPQISVLSFIKNHACTVQCTTSHICQRSDLDGAFSDEILKSLRRNHIAKSIIQRLKIRVLIYP